MHSACLEGDHTSFPVPEVAVEPQFRVAKPLFLVSKREGVELQCEHARLLNGFLNASKKSQDMEALLRC